MNISHTSIAIPHNLRKQIMQYLNKKYYGSETIPLNIQSDNIPLILKQKQSLCHCSYVLNCSLKLVKEKLIINKINDVETNILLVDFSK